ncbi:hypothetical protein SMD22_06590 [Brevibacillus halotolerans]|nr:hypothetical protein SMD22_06590 [Brevibacillus halotolerans]
MFKITGLDKLEKELKGLQEKVDNLSSEPATFDELFSKSFMEKYTNSKSFDEFLILGGFEVTSQEDFENIDESALDAHVSENSQFDSWQLMLNKATEEYISKKLGS